MTEHGESIDVGAMLGDLDRTPTADHVERFEAVHDALKARLDDAEA